MVEVLILFVACLCLIVNVGITALNLFLILKHKEIRQEIRRVIQQEAPEELRSVDMSEEAEIERERQEYAARYEKALRGE